MRYVANARPRSGETAKFLRSRSIQRVLRYPAAEIANKARALAPVESGEYKAGIQLSRPMLGYRDNWGDRRTTVRVEATAPYSAAIEWGNTNRKAERVLRRAAGGGR